MYISNIYYGGAGINYNTIIVNPVTKKELLRLKSLVKRINKKRVQISFEENFIVFKSGPEICKVSFTPTDEKNLRKMLEKPNVKIKARFEAIKMSLDIEA